VHCVFQDQNSQFSANISHLACGDTVSPEGSLSGTPLVGTAGLNSFTVRASDPAGAYGEATLQITIKAASLPLPWSLARVGTVSDQATAWGDAASITIKSSGFLGGTADSGTFTWQMLSGDGEITARISGLQNATPSSRIGLDIRSAPSPNSKHLFVGTDGSGALQMIRRTKTGGSSTVSSVGHGLPPNLWLRLVRTGITVTIFSSSDGLNWKRAGRTMMALETSCYAGLWVSSGSSSVSTGVFHNVTLKP